jgi:hypothetical protein
MDKLNFGSIVEKKSGFGGEVDDGDSRRSR